MIFPTPAKALGSSASTAAPGAGGSRSAAGERNQGGVGGANYF